MEILFCIIFFILFIILFLFLMSYIDGKKDKKYDNLPHVMQHDWFVCIKGNEQIEFDDFVNLYLFLKENDGYSVIKQTRFDPDSIVKYCDYYEVKNNVKKI